jgi:hypothetical protein
VSAPRLVIDPVLALAAFVFLAAGGIVPASAADSPAAGLSEEEILARAEAAFRRGIQERARPAEARQRFAEAADAYQSLRQRGARNAALCRDLGNAALLAGRLPRAILAYREGLLLAPQDGDLQEALEYARDEVRYPAPGQFGRPPAEDWPVWLPLPPPGTLLTLAVAAYALACVAVSRWLMTRRRAAVLAGAALIAALVLGAGWGLRQVRRVGAERTPVAVIADDGVPLRLGNGPSYPRHDELPVLSRGMEARLLFQRGDWLQLEFPGGATGWVPRRHVLVGDS